jgi:hypothetical protein
MHRKRWKGLGRKQVSLFQGTACDSHGGCKVSHLNSHVLHYNSHNLEYVLNLSASIAILANLLITNYCFT